MKIFNLKDIFSRTLKSVDLAARLNLWSYTRHTVNNSVWDSTYDYIRRPIMLLIRENIARAVYDTAKEYQQNE